MIKYKVMAGRWATMRTPHKRYSRVGYINIPYIFGGLSIPIPIVRVESITV